MWIPRSPRYCSCRTTSAFHLPLSLAMGLSSSMELWGGVSINRLPVWSMICWVTSAWYMIEWVRSSPNYMSHPTQAPFSNLFDQIKAGCEWPSFCWDRATCSSCEHCTISTVNPTHRGSVSNAFSPHMIVGLVCCSFSSFAIWTAMSASLPSKDWGFSGLCALL